MRSLAIITAVLCLALVPAGLALAGTARNYVATARDISAVRVKVLDLRLPTASAGGYQRANPGPDVTLSVYGVRQTALTLAEINFALEWQGARMSVASAFPNVPIPQGNAATFTVETNLDPVNAERARALLASGEKGFQLVGNVRLQLPHSDVSVWLDLRGQVQILAPITVAAR